MAATRYEIDSDGTRWAFRDIVCDYCGKTFAHRRPTPARGRWPDKHPECAVASNRDKSRERQRQIRAGKHKPQWRPTAPLADLSDWGGLGSRTAMSNTRAQAITDYWDNNTDFNETDALDALQRVMSGDESVKGVSERRPRKAPVPSGDLLADGLRWALNAQRGVSGWHSHLGPDADTQSSVLLRDPVARAWFDAHPQWWVEPKPDGSDGGYGVEPSPTPPAGLPQPGDDWARSVIAGRPVSLDDWPNPEPIGRILDLTGDPLPAWPDARVRAMVCSRP